MTRRLLTRLRWQAIANMIGEPAKASISARKLASRIVVHQLHRFDAEPCTRCSVLAVLCPSPKPRPFVEPGGAKLGCEEGSVKPHWCRMYGGRPRGEPLAIFVARAWACPDCRRALTSFHFRVMLRRRWLVLTRRRSSYFQNGNRAVVRLSRG